MVMTWTFLEVPSMVVTWWIVACCAVYFLGAVMVPQKTKCTLTEIYSIVVVCHVQFSVHLLVIIYI